MKLLSGLEADRQLSEAIPLWMKLTFLATNLPYWTIAWVALVDSLGPDFRGAHVHVCGRPELYALGGFLVAASSTLMHGSQLRLGQCFCCLHPQRTELFHEASSQKLFKKVDVLCAVSALLACVACRTWGDVMGVFSIALPLFVAGVVLKRMAWHYSYLVAHGLWHVVTSALAADFIWRRGV